jgi:Domain of unknown function (DUF4349)
MNNNQSLRFGFLPRYVSWLTIVLALLTIGTLIAVSGPGARYVTGRGGGYSGTTMAVPPTAVGTPMVDTSASNAPSPEMTFPGKYPYPYQNPNVPVTDTREFLQVFYNATMRTRDVPGLTRTVETTVRGFDGRIDQESSSAQYGSVSFAIPQSKYDAFRAQLESLVDNRFLTVSISSQNLLPQKVSIEQQQTQANASLADAQATRQKIVNAHASAVQSLQQKINADADQLALLRAEPSTPQLLAQIQTVSDDSNSLKQQLANENNSYTAQLSNADSNIKYAQSYLTAVQTQDQTLLNNVATVTGTVSIQWISLWEMALLYLPGYWIPAIFAALTVLSYLRDRRRSLSPIS